MRKTEAKTEAKSTTTVESKETHRHYWVIEAARGPISRGVCKFCGAVKEFHNSWPYFPAGKTTERVPEEVAGGRSESEE